MAGHWLRAFQEEGVEELLGFEGDWIADKVQVVSPGTIRIMNLNEPNPTSRIFSLAMSLEVAEHLLKENARPFVAALCASAPVVLFSAAIPGQGGTKHINERWQDYWASLFAENDYEPWDVVRPLIADEKRIDTQTVQVDAASGDATWTSPLVEASDTLMETIGSATTMRLSYVSYR